MASNPLLALPSMEADRTRVEEELLAAVRTDEPRLTEMARHLIVAGGKRIRPLFAVAAGACAENHEGQAERNRQPVAAPLHKLLASCDPRRSAAMRHRAKSE